MAEAADDVWQVFDSLAKELLLGALEGVNATVFAYGQTGPGKTFTVTGGPKRYADRGLIPRSICFLFQSIAQRRASLHQARSDTPARLPESSCDAWGGSPAPCWDEDRL